MVNLDAYNQVLKVDKERRTMLVQGGMRLQDLNDRANEVGWTMPNLGSINVQSIVGAISTATHGSSLRHGLMSENVKSLRIVLANGRAVRCSAEQNSELFRTALISLGALGIIVEVEYQLTEACNIEWTQTLEPLAKILNTWDKELWTQKEFTRVWWMPYMKRAIVWSAEKTSKPSRQAVESWYGGSVGFHTYHNLLWLSNYVPRILPWVEWFVFGMQYGFRTGQTTSAVEPLKTGLLMNCLYSQFVNEWALPLAKGPEAIERLSAWINREAGGGDIPFSNKNLYVHCPIEVRVSDSTFRDAPRPYLDNTSAEGPTLYLNATLYRPYLQDPPCKDRYYEAFEWLMREVGAKPHYAKNWQFTSSAYIEEAFGDDLKQWCRVRNEADPEGMFLGECHRQALGLGGGAGASNESHSQLSLLEREKDRKPALPGSCQFWRGALSFPVSPAVAGDAVDSTPASGVPRAEDSPGASSSGESFDMLHGSEAEKSVLYNGDEEDVEGEEVEEDVAEQMRAERRFHGHPRESWTGTRVFDKM
ncbi:hypothetical protein B0A50_07037 [Salinomyces thailandicus]|uniref:D-arabinono-1,4-lactone oxidase n=1 Tax=Salinomyces thailandicus TaxID=706561 RepID=A0A4U0TPT6_9PEZI|nr:hypothetical protein B0A50_07037 [Salinomyces thailandica]